MISMKPVIFINQNSYTQLNRVDTCDRWEKLTWYARHMSLNNWKYSIHNNIFSSWRI